jgi:hypothetical protein
VADINRNARPTSSEYALQVIATGEPDRVYLCHCKACQRRTGTAFHFGASFPKERVRLDGERKIYERDADSGYRIRFHFCPNCDSTLYLGGAPQSSGLRSRGRCVRHVSLSTAQRLDLGGVDASVARSAAEDGPPPTGPTTDHMSRTACLDGKMSTATVRRATTQDADVLGTIGPAAYAEAYGYLWDRPDAYFDQLRTFGAPAFASLLTQPDARLWIGEVEGAAVGFLSMIVGSLDPIERR